MTATYPQYIDADSQWLDKIPMHWRVARLDHVAEAWPSNVDKHVVEGEQPVRLCNYTDVYKNPSILEGMDFMVATASPEQIKRFRIAVGDTLLTKDSETADDIGVPAYVEYEAPDLLCGYHLSIVRPRPGAANPKFLYWALTAGPTLGQWEVLASGVTRVGIRSGDLAKVALALPTVPEQRAIADYLDRETARIDTLIEEQQRLIGILRERRLAVLAEASDVEAAATRLGLMLDGIKDGTHGTFARTAPPEGRPLLGARNVMDGHLAIDGEESFISDADAEAITSNGFPRSGDVLLVIVGATIGKTAVYEEDMRHAFQRSVAFLRPSAALDPYFLWYQIQSARFQDELALRSKTSAQPGIYLGDVASIPVRVPPLDVQLRIVRDLNQQFTKINTLITEAERFIELARERRSALITAAVTGQIDVHVAA